MPRTITDYDSQSQELGVQFTAKYAGQVTGMRFYKGPQNTGTHVGNLWTGNGTRLASVTFTNEKKSGWQTATFSSPVSISANTGYVISYFAPRGHYSVTENYFKAPRVSGALTALKVNGVYALGNRSVFPNHTYKGGNYWVDVIYSTSRFDPSPLPVAPPVAFRQR